MLDSLATVERPPVAAQRAVMRLEAGSTKDEALTAFIGWLASLLVEIPVTVEIVEALGPDGEWVAGWLQGGVLFLGARHRAVWEDPLSARFLGLLCHEAAHERAPTHDADFQRELQRMAGTLAALCMNRGGYMIDRWLEGAS